MEQWISVPNGARLLGRRRATHGYPTRIAPGERAAPSGRCRSRRNPRLTLATTRYVGLDQAHEEAALSALAELLATYTDPDDVEVA